MISVDINNGQKLQLVDNTNIHNPNMELLKLDSKGNLVDGENMTHGEFVMLMNAFRNHKNGMDVNLKDYLS